MNCIIVDDEPLAREAMKLLIEEKLFIHILDMYVRNNKNFKEI